VRVAWGPPRMFRRSKAHRNKILRPARSEITFKHDGGVVKRLDLDFCGGMSGRVLRGCQSPPLRPSEKNILPRLAVFLQKGTFTGTPGLSRESTIPIRLCSFLWRKRKRTKRNRPRPGATGPKTPAATIDWIAVIVFEKSHTCVDKRPVPKKMRGGLSTAPDWERT
jgi:hypothetical protein